MTGAILLAGGRASRVGGAAKPLFDVGGITLLQRAIDAVAEASPITVVADPVPGVTGVQWVREDPPFGGPAAAVAAALAQWPLSSDPEWACLLGCDLPGASAAVARLDAALPLLPADAEGVCLADPHSRPQWLIGVYRTAVLRRGAAALADGGHGASMRALVADAAITVIAAPEAETADVDTWEDLAQARQRHEHDRREDSA